MDTETLKPQHINATQDDMAGNGALGRYVILVGSEERASSISQLFSDIVVKPHPRQHNIYLGSLLDANNKIDVAVVSSGMGSASADIIVSELLLLGAKRILRVGTAGSLQPNYIKTGDVVIASAAVRDDKSSWDYIHREFPAIASREWIEAILLAYKSSDLSYKAEVGIIHTKSSLYAREMGLSFLHSNSQYMQDMSLSGVLASEMETAQLYILTSLFNAKLKRQNEYPVQILSGSILAIVGDNSPFSNNENLVKSAISCAIDLGLESIKQLAKFDREGPHS